MIGHKEEAAAAVAVVENLLISQGHLCSVELSVVLTFWLSFLYN